MKTIKSRIVALAIVCLLILSLASAYFFNSAFVKKSELEINQLSLTMNESFDLLIRSEVETLHSVLQQINKLYEQGELSSDQAYLLATSILREVRYGKEGYFWADKTDGTNVVLLGRDSEGKNRYNMVDQKGNPFIEDIINAGINGGGYTNYWFSKKTGGEPLPKRSFSMLSEPFDLVIGTGNYINDIETVLIQRIAENKSAQKRIFLGILLILFIFLMISGVLAYIVGNRISKPLHVLMQKSTLISRGELNINFDEKGNGEIGILNNMMQLMVDKLREIIDAIRSGTGQITMASSEINKSSQIIAGGSNNQASSVEELSAAMSEIVDKVKENTHYSKETERISNELNSKVKNVREMAIKSNDAIKVIADRINIINEIAFQTNILSLNASVEAARAGDAGKGFAVVANEVRKLASKSRVSADEITELAQIGVELTNSTTNSLLALIPEIEDTTHHVQSIAHASENQEVNAIQVNNAISELSETTNQNAASSEELAAASEELTTQAINLQGIIGFFK